jgi:hypothetical protein
VFKPFARTLYQLPVGGRHKFGYGTPYANRYASRRNLQSGQAGDPGTILIDARSREDKMGVTIDEARYDDAAARVNPLCAG